MTEHTTNAPLRFSDDEVKVRKEILDDSAAQHVYRGDPLIMDVSEDTLYLRRYLDATVLVTATDVFIGFALEEKAVATTDTEVANEIEVVESGYVGIKSTVFTNADRGKYVVMTSSDTLAAGVIAAGNLGIGRLAYVEDGYAYVLVNPDGPTVQTFG
jgi:hypothetical protein